MIKDVQAFFILAEERFEPLEERWRFYFFQPPFTAQLILDHGPQEQGFMDLPQFFT